MSESMSQSIEHLNAALREAEQKIQLMGFTCPGEVVLPSGASLAYDRRPNGWCLLICAPDAPENPGDRSPLLSASRALRIEAAHALPGLVKALQEAEIRIGAEVCEAVKAAEAFIKACK